MEEKDIIEQYYEHILDKKKFPKYKEAAFKIWKDLNGRRGVGFDEVDYEIQLEALYSWCEIIKSVKK